MRELTAFIVMASLQEDKAMAIKGELTHKNKFVLN